MEDIGDKEGYFHTTDDHIEAQRKFTSIALLRPSN